MPTIRRVAALGCYVVASTLLDARHGVRGPDPRGPERLLHRQSGLELFGERSDDPPRTRRGAGEHESPSPGFSPSGVL